MQDILLTVPDLHYCYEVAKTARRAWTTLATRNLHVGIFKSPHPPPPLFRTPSFRIEMFFGSMARWCGGGSSVPILKYLRVVRLRLVFLAQLFKEEMQERQVTAIFTCDGYHFQETNTCVSSIRSMYVSTGKVAHPARG